VLGDANGAADVFARNLTTGGVTTVSLHPDGSQLAGPSSQGAISADARYVAFSSQAPDVVPGEPTDARPRIFRRDIVTGALDEVTAGIDLRPSSLIGEPFGVNLRRKVHLIAGTAEDDGHVGSAARKSRGGRSSPFLRG
jgi:hypothetical protein